MRGDAGASGVLCWGSQTWTSGGLRPGWSETWVVQGLPERSEALLPGMGARWHELQALMRLARRQALRLCVRPAMRLCGASAPCGAGMPKERGRPWGRPCARPLEILVSPSMHPHSQRPAHKQLLVPPAPMLPPPSPRQGWCTIRVMLSIKHPSPSSIMNPYSCPPHPMPAYHLRRGQRCSINHNPLLRPPLPARLLTCSNRYSNHYSPAVTGTQTTAPGGPRSLLAQTWASTRLPSPPSSCRHTHAHARVCAP